MTKYINIIFNQLLFYLFIGIIYPCTNCSIPIANAGDDFDVINGGVGILDGTTSYDPDDFELELMYFWYSEDNIISYCGDIDECSGERYYCEGYENVYLTEDECENNNHTWVQGAYNNWHECFSAGFIWAHTDSKTETECNSAGHTWKPGSITLDDYESKTPNITAINLGAITSNELVKLKLIVNDGDYNSEPDEIKLTINPLADNTVPIANAGLYQNAFKGDTVIVSGGASYDTTNTGMIYYTWSQESGTTITFIEPDSNSPFRKFTIPEESSNADISEELIFRLVVNDGLSDSSDPSFVSVYATYNYRPISDAGLDQNLIPTGSLVTLNGSQSYDLDNTGDLTYSWTGPGNIDISDPTSSIITFMAPDEAGELVFELEVNDGQQSSSVWSGIDLFISEYISYSGEIYLEIYNGTGEDVNMSGYEIWVMRILDDGNYESGYSHWPNRKFVFDPNYSAANDPTFYPEYMDYDSLGYPDENGHYIKGKNVMVLNDQKGEAWYDDCKYIHTNNDCNDDGVLDDPCGELILPNKSTLMVLRNEFLFSEGSALYNEIMNSNPTYSDQLNDTYIEWVRSTTSPSHKQSNPGLDKLDGNDAIGLVKNSILIDVVGNNGGNINPWPVAGIEGATDGHALIRKPTIVKGNDKWWENPNGDSSCDRADYSYCDTGSAGSNVDNSEWIVKSDSLFRDVGGHLCTSCDNQVVIEVKNNFAPFDVVISGADEYGNVIDTDIVKGFRRYLTGYAIDTTSTPQGKLFYWKYPENVQLKTMSGSVVERFTDDNSNGIWDEGEVYDDNNNYKYDGGDTLVYFETELLDTVVYSFQLTVSDGDLHSEPGNINIKIIDENTPPIAEGGTYGSVDENNIVRLIATDDDLLSKSYDETSTGQMLSYFWKPLKVNQYGASRVEWESLGISTNENPEDDNIPDDLEGCWTYGFCQNEDTLQFVMPKSLGQDSTFNIELTVCDSRACTYKPLQDSFECSDGLGLCSHDTLVVSMDNPQYPVAIIDQSNGEICSQGSDFNSTCSLSANNSFDPNGDGISYKWHSTELYIEENGQKELIFSPHKDSLGTKHVEIKEDTEYDILLEVTDSSNKLSLKDTITIKVAAQFPYAEGSVEGFRYDVDTTYIVAQIPTIINGFSFAYNEKNKVLISGDPNANLVTAGFYNYENEWQEASRRVIAEYRGGILSPLSGYGFNWKLPEEIDYHTGFNNSVFTKIEADYTSDIVSIILEVIDSTGSTFLTSRPDTTYLRVVANQPPVAVVNHIYNAGNKLSCKDDLDEFTRTDTSMAHSFKDSKCWDIRIGTNPDKINVLSGANYTFDGSHSFDDSPTGEIYYNWESLDGLLFLPDSVITSASPKPEVVVPDSLSRSYMFTLQVSDNGDDWSEKDTISVMTAKPSTLNSPLEFYAKVVPDVNHIQLVWTSEPERELDSLTGYRDFEGYRLYRSTDGGVTWGDAESRIYDFEGKHVGWKPYARFDMTEAKDTSACLYQIDKLGQCASEIYRGIDVVGADPKAPWINLGTDNGLQTTFIDSNVFDGVEYTYSITAYDMGLRTYDFAYLYEHTFIDTMKVDSFMYNELEYDIDSSFVRNGKEYYVLSFLNSNYVSGSEIPIYSESLNWNRSNPGYYTFYGDGLVSLESQIGSDNGSSIPELWDDNYIRIRPGFHASNIQFPDLDKFVAQDCDAIGNGNQFFEIVNDYQLADFISSSEETLIRLEVQANLDVIENGKVVKEQNIYENYHTENPYIYIYNVKKHFPSSSAPEYHPSSTDLFSLDNDVFEIYWDQIETNEEDGTALELDNPVWHLTDIIDIPTNSNLDSLFVISIIDSVLSLPGADTTSCGDNSLCLQLPNYIIDPSPLLYNDDANLSANWTDVFNGVRFRFDNARRKFDAYDYTVNVKELNYSDTLLNQLLDIDFMYVDKSKFDKRPPYAYKIIFSTEPADTAAFTRLESTNCGIYSTLLPFRIYNLITGKKVGLMHDDKGIYNGCENVPQGSEYECEENDDLGYTEHPGANDCIWQRNEEIQLQDDLVTSSFGEDGEPDGLDDLNSYFSHIYDLFIKFSLNRVPGYSFSKDWSSGSSYKEDDIVEHSGMLWQTPDDIAAGSDLSKTPPSEALLNEFQININPWYMLYPWQDGDSLIIIPERWYVDGDAWVSDLSLLGEVGAISQGDLDKIKVVPNPFIVQSGFSGGQSNSIRFTHLPTQCQIYIYTVSGEFVDHISHDSPVDGNEFWDLKNGKGQDVAPGLYIYTVETLNDLKKIGKFAIVR